MKFTQSSLKDSVKNSSKTVVLALALSLISGNLVAQQAAVQNTAATVAGGQAVPVSLGPWTDPITHAPFPSHASKSAGTENPANNQEGKAAGDGSVHQGLKVHGHWVINVRNPDGTLAEHREFENSLESKGGGFLVGLLSGYFVPGDWMIVLGPQSGNGACTATYEFCGLVRTTATYPAVGYCNIYYCTGSTLSYTYNFGNGFNGPYSIVLSGTITANQTGTIGSVATVLNTCANIAYSSTVNPSTIATVTPATCVPQTAQQPWYGPLTSTNITPIAITSGQLVQAIVTITFS